MKEFLKKNFFGIKINQRIPTQNKNLYQSNQKITRVSFSVNTYLQELFLVCLCYLLVLFLLRILFLLVETPEWF